MQPITRRRFLTISSLAAVGAAVASIVPYQSLRQVSIFDANGIVASRPITGVVSTFANVRGLINRVIVHSDEEVFDFTLDTPINMWDDDTLEITWEVSDEIPI